MLSIVQVLGVNSWSTVSLVVHYACAKIKYIDVAWYGVEESAFVLADSQISLIEREEMVFSPPTDAVPGT